jgi:transposase
MMLVCLAAFDWALYQRNKGAVKLHLVLDHDGYVPKFAVISDGKTHEIEVARQQQYEAGTVLVFDRGSTDFQWRLKLSQQKVFFVMRLKDNAEYGVIEQRPVAEGCTILRDEVIQLTALQEQGPVARMRRIELWVEEKNETMVFVNNHLKLAASTVAAIYRDRWQIELSFKAIKQSLRIKGHRRNSPNNCSYT